MVKYTLQPYNLLNNNWHSIIMWPYIGKNCTSASTTTVFDSGLIICARWSSSSEIMVCAQCSFVLTVFTVIASVISPMSKRSISWRLTGWWSTNTHTVFLGDDEDEWWLRCFKSLWWDVRVSTQGSIRFPHWYSVLPQSIHSLGLLSPGESSFLLLSVRKHI